MLRCEDLKQEREAVGDCIMELESDFLTETNEKKVVMILNQACRNVNVENPSRSCGSADSIIRSNELTHFNPSSLYPSYYIGQ